MIASQEVQVQRSRFENFNQWGYSEVVERRNVGSGVKSVGSLVLKASVRMRKGVSKYLEIQGEIGKGEIIDWGSKM